MKNTMPGACVSTDGALKYGFLFLMKEAYWIHIMYTNANEGGLSLE